MTPCTLALAFNSTGTNLKMDIQIPTHCAQRCGHKNSLFSVFINKASIVYATASATGYTISSIGQDQMKQLWEIQ